MIRLKRLINEAGDYTAKSKESGKLVHFKSKDSYDAAIKAGSHEDPNAKTSKGGTSKVNIFNEPAATEPDGMATVKSIAAKTGMRAQAIAGWADENGVNLSKVSSDIDSKKLKPMDLMTAVVGKPGNKYAKDIVAKYSQSSPKATPADLAVDKVVYNTRTKSVGIVRMADERGETKTDADGNVNSSELEPYNPMKYPHQKDAKVAPSTQKEVDARGLWNPFSTNEPKKEPKGTSVFDTGQLDASKLEPGSLSKALYGDPNKEPDVVAKPVGNPDLSKFSNADKDWFTKGHAVISTMYDDNLTIGDLQNLFKAKGYGDVTDKTLADMVADYNDDEDMQDRFKDRGMTKRKFLARIKDLNSQLKSSSTTTTSAPKAQRKGDPTVNKEVRKIAQKMGISSDKMDKNEYQKKMAQAAVAALTDSNFHSEARELVAALEGKPEMAEKPDYPSLKDPKYDEKMKVIRAKYDSVYSSPDDDAEDLGIAASQAAGWSGDTAIDGIAFELRMNGFHKLADKIQSVIKEGKSNRTSLKNLIK